MTKTCLRDICLALVVAVVVSCGGGGGGGGVMPIAAGGAAGAPGAAPANTSAQQSLLDRTVSPAGGGSGPGDTGSANGSGGTSVAGGDDGSGVGSGGTGVSTADATGIGSVDGAGSILVNGVRYNTDGAVVALDDVPGLQLGMTAKVIGPFDNDLTMGSAKRVESSIDLRGPVTSVNAQQASFTILGTTVTTDAATVWADSNGITDVTTGATLQVWGLPSTPGSLRATRVEVHASGTPILSGAVQNLDTAMRRFSIGGYVIDYSQAAVTGGNGGTFANGVLVRVRANTIGANLLVASAVQWWYPAPIANGTQLQLAGVVTDFAGLNSLRVLGVRVDASAAKVSGGPANSVGNGVGVIVGGVLSNGVLQASTLKIRLVPGTGGQPSFSLTGQISTFNSIADFRIKGQPIDASGPGVSFVNGTAANLGAQVRVMVEGSRVAEGVLIADRVTFQ
ncbi:DUF5666 domain-containing protein [Variovorax sp. Sphag1AA]|uniref:DUF5666 domain-containing protein n=1 Tax=Variovorax sp. Sphag1AA TaxID=2587027 RepID=UPI00160E4FF6|nr:DUF5666 domain-containing protein [Variovorax sp. Sphag1AA]MBB3180329.1 hypothetical protein [Variovorax sp. Sphag1AA]